LLAKPWLLSVFHDNAGIVAFDEEDAFCIKVETHNSPSALDPYGGALTGIVGVNRDILGCGFGAKPIFNTDVFCVAPLDYDDVLPHRVLHPRRILDGIRRGVEHGGNKSGIPTVNGALVFDERFLGKPLVFCGTGGFMPRSIAGKKCELKEIRSGDHICMVGGRIGKDGVHGATFSSLALTDISPVSAVQLGDPITQKRMSDFLLVARDLGLYRAITDNGAGGLSSSVGELALLSNGARMDVGLAKTKYHGLKPYELVISESQERMTVAVAPEKLSLFLALAERHSIEVSQLGVFTQTGKFEILYNGNLVGCLDLEFLHKGVPRLELKAEWNGKVGLQIPPSMSQDSEALWGSEILLELLSQPNIASKEWMIRQYDHEVQGCSVIKPLHSVGVGTLACQSGPNDAAVIKPKHNSFSGLAIGCGINPKLSFVDPYIMAQYVVDEAIRNVLCVGVEYGKSESVLSLVDNFCWPDPTQDPGLTGALVRACYGLHDASLNLGIPLVSGKDSMKNDYHGIKNGKPCKISVTPTLLMTAVGKVADIRLSRTSDFKSSGDVIYLLGLGKFGLLGTEYQTLAFIKNKKNEKAYFPENARAFEPDWKQALKIYQWLGGAHGKKQTVIKSLHDISDGGVLIAVAECLLARGFGAQIEIPQDREKWEFCFGEGFHSFIASVAESDAAVIETEWQSEGIFYLRLGNTTTTNRLNVTWKSSGHEKNFSVPTQALREAWRKEGYWQ
ncbi:MAG: phosphoribosylformylglycinamidine synthase, partial [Deltaproteobacteria bacterium]|nr:phosphoribosylformylglycinamidine synthase [Deltaproteobacteria bacterium]